MVRNALRVNLLPIQPLLAQFDGLGYRRFGRTARAGRKIQLQFVDNPLFETPGIFGDLMGVVALKDGCDSPDGAVEILSTSARLAETNYFSKATWGTGTFFGCRIAHKPAPGYFWKDAGVPVRSR